MIFREFINIPRGDKHITLDIIHFFATRAFEPVDNGDQNTEASLQLARSSLTHYIEYWLLEAEDTPPQAVYKETLESQPESQDYEAVLASLEKGKAKRIIDAVACLNNAEFTCAIVHIKKGPLLSFTVRFTPHPLINVEKLRIIYHELNKPPPKVRTPTSSRWQGPGPQPKSNEPLMILPPPYVENILKKWPNPALLRVDQALVAFEKEQRNEQYRTATRENRTAAAEEDLATESTEKGEDRTVKEEWHTVSRDEHPDGITPSIVHVGGYRE